MKGYYKNPEANAETLRNGWMHSGDIAIKDEYGDGWKFHKNQYIYIAVDNLQNVYKKMKHSDCKYVGEIGKMPWGETLFYANDPFDNPICFVDEKTIFTGE